MNERLLEILTKYDFIDFLKAQKIKGFVSLNLSSYCPIEGGLGAFKRGRKWCAYKEGPMNQVYAEQIFNTQEEAYDWIASNFKKRYTRSSWVNSWLTLKAGQKVLKLTLIQEYYDKIISALPKLPDGHTAISDKGVILSELKRAEKEEQRDTIRQIISKLGDPQFKGAKDRNSAAFCFIYDGTQDQTGIAREPFIINEDMVYYGTATKKQRERYYRV